MIDCTEHECRCFWLAEGEFPNLRLVDGCHNDAEGVAKAAKLMNHIFDRSGPWAMVEISAVPDLDVAIDERSTRALSKLVKGKKLDQCPMCGHPDGAWECDDCDDWRK